MQGVPPIKDEISPSWDLKEPNPVNDMLGWIFSRAFFNYVNPSFQEQEKSEMFKAFSNLGGSMGVVDDFSTHAFTKIQIMFEMHNITTEVNNNVLYLIKENKNYDPNMQLDRRVWQPTSRPYKILANEPAGSYVIMPSGTHEGRDSYTINWKGSNYSFSQCTIAKYNGLWQVAGPPHEPENSLDALLVRLQDPEFMAFVKHGETQPLVRAVMPSGEQ